jgi:hypothetical protein
VVIRDGKFIAIVVLPPLLLVSLTQFTVFHNLANPVLNTSRNSVSRELSPADDRQSDATDLSNSKP